MTPPSSHRKPDGRDNKDSEGVSKTDAYPGMGKDHSGVYPRRHGVGIWGNRRVPMTVRVDEGLKKAFLSFCNRVFGSSCLPFEGMMAGILGAVVEVEKRGVYPSATVPLKFDVGKIVIERNFKTRRKFIEEETEVTEKVVVVDKKSSQLDRVFWGVADQWLLHRSREWRWKWQEKAREHSELSNAALVLSLSATAGWSS